MLTHEIKFLTIDVNLHLKNEDYQINKYETKKKTEQSVFDSAKRSYCEKRGGHWRAACPRQLKRLENYLKDRNIVFSEFTRDSLITVVFSSGAIAYISVKLNSLDITQVLFDRFCVGKLSSQTVTAVAITKSHMLFIHVDRVATLVTFGKTDTALPCRMSDREPHIQIIELGGYSRRTERKLSYYEHNNKTYVLIWSVTTSEPAPWSPVLEDLANLHLYEFDGTKTTLVAHHQLENETLLAELSQSPETVHTVEQIICHKTGVTVTWSCFPARGGARGEARHYVCAPVRVCVRASERLLLACIDGSLHLAHHRAGITHTTKPGFIVTDVRWSGSLVVAADENGRIQCYDRALQLLHHSSKCLDLTSCFNEPKKFKILSTQAVDTGIVQLVMFNTGPIALLRMSHPRLLTAWLRLGRTSNAVSLLRSLDWDQQGPECLSAVTHIVDMATRGGPALESSAQAAIGAYMAPIAPHRHKAKTFSQPVYRLARKFFHHLLRRGRIEKALSLAVDLEAWDLFVDARWAANRCKLQHLVEEASSLAAYYSQFEQQDSECSTSCSRCSSPTSSGSDTSSEPPVNHPPLPRLNMISQVTPQPTLTNSIRPNPHQYLERDNNMWKNEAKNDPDRMIMPQVQIPQQPTNSIRPNLHQYVERDNNMRKSETKEHPDRTMLQVLTPQSTNSIRPKQYLERDSALWNSETKDAMKTKWTDNILNTQLSTISEVPRRYNVDVPQNVHAYRNGIQSEYQSKKDLPNTIYRYRNNYASSTSAGERNFELERKPPERNKVKFSDTVTVAVVVKEPTEVPAVERELADSLPLCPPHKYLAAFEPHPHSSQLTLSRDQNVSEEQNLSHIGQQNAKPPKIKVVHFGMV